jgi:hypothetical protein
MSFGELAARFLAEGGARPWHIDRLKLLLPYWSEIPIGRITKSMAADYRRRRHAAKAIMGHSSGEDVNSIYTHEDRSLRRGVF